FNGVLFTLSISLAQKFRISKLPPLAGEGNKELSLLISLVESSNINGINKTEAIIVNPKTIFFLLFLVSIDFGCIIKLK
ncbi:MAG: hypothetical protein KGD70_16200, partial [Candidatus Lokiarchaeota archaeon]|nr:hypothetical protein [Candidatus Lokiarchaeota archaeon]